MGSESTATSTTSTSATGTTTTESTTTSTTTTVACKGWCTGANHRNTPWSAKCKWSGCSACAACKQYVPAMVCSCDVRRNHSDNLPVLCQKDGPETWQGRPNTVVCMAPLSGRTLCP